jgi:hypothetical protein
MIKTQIKHLFFALAITLSLPLWIQAADDAHAEVDDAEMCAICWDNIDDQKTRHHTPVKVHEFDSAGNPLPAKDIHMFHKKCLNVWHRECEANGVQFRCQRCLKQIDLVNSPDLFPQRQETIDKFFDDVKIGRARKIDQALKEHPSLVLCSDVSGMTPLMYAAVSGKSNTITKLLVAQKLLAGVDATGEASEAFLNATDLIGQTALMMAAAAGNIVSVRVLMNAGADHTLVDGAGNTALMLANMAYEADKKRFANKKELKNKHLAELWNLSIKRIEAVQHLMKKALSGTLPKRDSSTYYIQGAK